MNAMSAEPVPALSRRYDATFEVDANYRRTLP
jgi:hypothetical protein